MDNESTTEVPLVVSRAASRLGKRAKGRTSEIKALSSAANAEKARAAREQKRREKLALNS